MEINSIGSAADNIAAVKKVETEAKTIMEAGNDLKKVKAPEDEEVTKKVNEAVKTDKAGSAEAAQGITNAQTTKEAGNTLDIMG